MFLVNQFGNILIGERFNEVGVWQLPQGGVEEGSSLEENVLRELEEEIGIDRSSLRIIKKLEARHQYEWDMVPDYALGKWRGQSQTFWLVEFKGEDEEIDLGMQDPEFRAWQWCSPNELLKLVEPKRVVAYRAALEEVIAYLQDI